MLKFADTPLTPIDIFASSSALVGKVDNGYVAGATVLSDTNNNGTADFGEITTQTDGAGQYTLAEGPGPLVASGGTNISTGLPFQLQLRAPLHSSVITPLTTLMVKLTEMGLTQTEQKVLDAFDVSTTSGLTESDPISDALANNSSAFSAGAKVDDTIVSIASAVSGGGSSSFASAAQLVFETPASAINALNAGQLLDHSSKTVISNLISSVFKPDRFLSPAM